METEIKLKYTQILIMAVINMLHAESHGEPNMLEWRPSSLAKCKTASDCFE